MVLANTLKKEARYSMDIEKFLPICTGAVVATSSKILVTFIGTILCIARNCRRSKLYALLYLRPGLLD